MSEKQLLARILIELQVISHILSQEPLNIDLGTLRTALAAALNVNSASLNT